jgi:hypothetical protein
VLPAIGMAEMESPAPVLLAPLAQGLVIAVVTSLGTAESGGPTP